MEVKILVFRNSETLAKNEPCVREFVSIEDGFDFSGVIKAFKLIWPDCCITFSI